MSVEVIKRVVEKLDNEIEERDLGMPFFSNPEYHSFSLSKERFKKIERVKLTRKVAYIDGGNRELIGAPNFSVQINRVYYDIFCGLRNYLVPSAPGRAAGPRGLPRCPDISH